MSALAASSAVQSEIIISGLTVEGVSDIRRLAFAGLRAIYDDLEMRDIIPARLLRSRYPVSTVHPPAHALLVAGT